MIRGIACSRIRFIRLTTFVLNRVVKESVCCIKNVIETLKITKSGAFQVQFVFGIHNRVENYGEHRSCCLLSCASFFFL